MKLLPFNRWTLADVDPPWDGKSLFEILEVNGPDATLPERAKRNENELGWVAGALDGVTGHHFNRAESDQIRDRTKPVLGALARLLKHSTQEHLSVLQREIQRRVQVVERLDGTENAAIRAWMLRDGFRNDIMDEYLAGICARTGKLHEALSANSVDRALLDGAAGIIKALLCGGPADSIEDYREGPIAIQEYLRHVSQTSALSLEHLLCIGRLRYFLSEAAGWEDRYSKGWTSAARDEMLSECTRLRERPDWKIKIDSALRSPDNLVFYEADSAAQELGIDTRDIHFDRVRSEPLKSSSWYRLLQQTNEDQIEEVLSFAERALPLDEIATGPADSLGLGEKYAAHHALDWILQDLKRFPGHGWEFINIGLQSPVTRNRNMALNALLEWPKPSWPEEAPLLLARLRTSEPNEKLRERLESI